METTLMTPRFTIRLVLLLVTLSAVAAALFAVQPWKQERFRPAATREYNRYCELLRDELTGPISDSSDSGSYVTMTDENVSRCLSIGNTRWICEFHRHPHVGPSVYDRTFGSLTTTGARLFLEAKYETEWLQSNLYIVRWSDRRYLLAADETEEFRTAIANSEEPRNTLEGRFFMRIGDEKKLVTGLPTIPDVSQVFNE